MEKKIRLPHPHDREIEEVVLGAFITEPTAIAKVKERMKAEMFFYPEHQLVYGAIETLYEAGTGIDVLTVTDELRRTDKLEKLGGPYFVTQFASRVVSSAHLEYHIGILTDLYVRRTLIHSTQELLGQAMDMTYDITDVLEEARKRLDGIDGVYTLDTLRDMPRLLEDTLQEGYHRMQHNKDGITGIPTGLNELDRLTAGFQPGELTILAGRPAMGKTAVSLCMALAAAEAGTKVVYYSIEMTGERLMDRWIVGKTGISPERWKGGTITKEEDGKIAESITYFKQLPIKVDDNPMMSMDYIYSRTRLLCQKEQCDAIYIDYLQLSDTKGGKYNNRVTDIGEATQKAKLMAKKLNIPVILLSQLNRKSEEKEDKRPELANLRESGNIEQDADLVILIHNPEKAGLKREERSGYPVEGLGILIVAKNRNGRTGNIYFGYNESMTRIGDYVPPVDWMEKNTQKRPKAKELRAKGGEIQQ